MSVPRPLARGLVLVVYVGLAALALVAGRGHTLVLKNGPASRSAEANGSAAAGDSTPSGGPALKVAVDGAPAVDIGPSDARSVEVRGAKHRLHIEYPDGRAAVAGEVKIPFSLDRAVVDLSGVIASGRIAIEPASSGLREP